MSEPVIIELVKVGYGEAFIYQDIPYMVTQRINGEGNIIVVNLINGVTKTFGPALHVRKVKVQVNIEEIYG